MLCERMVELGQERSVIRELFEYGRARAAAVGADRVYDFSLGNPSAPPPPSVDAAIARALAEGGAALHGYTSAAGDPAARGAIAASLNRRFGTGYTGDHLYLTAGAAAALCCTFTALTCPGDEFILLAPYFPEYQVFLAAAGAKAVVVPTRPDTFQLDLAGLDAAITPRTKGIVLNSPNNPSGAVYPAAHLADLAALLREKSAACGHPIYLISDEPYRELTYDGVAVPWLPDFYDDTVVCYSYSKSLSLPGERIGYILVPPAAHDSDRLYAAVCGAGRSLGYVCAPALFQRVAAACDGDHADLAVYAENRRLLLEGLAACGMDCPPPGGAFYLFPRVPDGDDAAFCRRARDLDVLLVPGSGFGAPGYVRMAYCVPTARVHGALPLLRQLAELHL